jgi:hypothetical protein
MVEFGKAGLVFGLLVALPLAVWVGAMLTREGMPLGRFVDRWFRPLVVVLAVGHLLFGVNGPWDDFVGADMIYWLTFLLLAMLFMPMLRRLQRSTEKRDA